MGRTLKVRGAGGAVFDLDVPAGGHELERFLQRVESGDLTALDDDGDAIDRVALVNELKGDDDVIDDDDVELSAMTVKQLRARAELQDVDLGDAKTKAEILAVLEAHDADD